MRRMIPTKRRGVAMPVELGRSLSPTLLHPMSYVGAILSTIGGDCQLLSQVLQSTTANESAAITLHQTACRRKRPRRRPGRRNVPQAPNPADEAIPSHPLPMMGGTSTPTTNHTKLSRANNQDPRSPMSSTSRVPMAAISRLGPPSRRRDHKIGEEETEGVSEEASGIPAAITPRGAAAG